MPLGKTPICTACRTTDSSMWRKDSDTCILCNSCFLHQSAPTTKDREETNISISDDESTNSNSGLRQAIVTAKQENAGVPVSATSASTSTTVRKSSRLKPARTKSTQNKNPNKGKSRRHIFKKKVPLKAEPSIVRHHTRDTMFYNGIYYQVGDIVSLVDADDDCLYFAQIRGLLQDQYCEKSAILQWLLPTIDSPDDRFEPSTYILGPTEELPRKLEYVEFECHAPDTLYRQKNILDNPLHVEEPDTGFIWTSVGPKPTKLPPNEEIFGGEDLDIDSVS